MTPAYSPLRMIDALIDEHIPDLGVPVSILGTYVTEALAQLEGPDLLASHRGTKSGYTVGTALVAHRHHRLRQGAFEASALSFRTPGFGRVKLSDQVSSLLHRLLLADVDLAVPDAHGRSAWVAAMLWPEPTHALTDAVRFMALQPDRAVLEALFEGRPPRVDPLHLDPDGCGLASARFHNERLVAPPAGTGVMEDVVPLALGYIDTALAAPKRSACGNRNWLERTLPRATADFAGPLRARLALWSSRAMEDSFQPPVRPNPARL